MPNKKFRKDLKSPSLNINFFASLPQHDRETLFRSMERHFALLMKEPKYKEDHDRYIAEQRALRGEAT